MRDRARIALSDLRTALEGATAAEKIEVLGVDAIFDLALRILDDASFGPVHDKVQLLEQAAHDRLLRASDEDGRAQKRAEFRELGEILVGYGVIDDPDHVSWNDFWSGGRVHITYHEGVPVLAVRRNDRWHKQAKFHIVEGANRQPYRSACGVYLSEFRPGVEEGVEFAAKFVGTPVDTSVCRTCFRALKDAIRLGPYDFDG